jgi:hypothetical protein
MHSLPSENRSNDDPAVGPGCSRLSQRTWVAVSKGGGDGCCSVVVAVVKFFDWQIEEDAA